MYRTVYHYLDPKTVIQEPKISEDILYFQTCEIESGGGLLPPDLRKEIPDNVAEAECISLWACPSPTKALYRLAVAISSNFELSPKFWYDLWWSTKACLGWHAYLKIFLLLYYTFGCECAGVKSHISLNELFLYSFKMITEFLLMVCLSR